jgi:hypothetical protein
VKRYRNTITGLKKRLATTTDACDAMRKENSSFLIIKNLSIKNVSTSKTNL